MDNAAADIERFFTTFRRLQRAGHGMPRTPPPEFFHQARALMAKRDERRRSSAARFNIFEALDWQRSELVHSCFLAHLLDPCGRHDQGSMFLQSFLQLLERAEWLQGIDETAVSVCTERAVPEGRLDIVIFLGDRYVLAIENKIDAQEQLQQVERYQKWLTSLAGPITTKALVFLTPSGVAPRTASRTASSVPVLELSYSNLARWITATEGRAPRALASVLRMYGYICAQIANTERDLFVSSGEGRE